jgi:hypothetical protein
MLWSEVRKWAKQHGYETIKEKGDEEKGDPVQYYWSKTDSPESSGVAKSVSKLATAIYNDMTDNKWLEHQKTYAENKAVSIDPNDR